VATIGSINKGAGKKYAMPFRGRWIKPVSAHFRNTAGNANIDRG
jgi:hypothetical protein